MNYQITLFCTTNQYKPVSCIVKKGSIIDLTNQVEKRKVVNDGIVKICHKRGWTQKELTKYSYTRVKVREFDKEKIEEEKRLNYERIKEQNYQTGVWQRPKDK